MFPHPSRRADIGGDVRTGADDQRRISSSIASIVSKDSIWRRITASYWAESSRPLKFYAGKISNERVSHFLRDRYAYRFAR